MQTEISTQNTTDSSTETVGKSYSRIADLAILRAARKGFESLAKNTRALWVVLGISLVVAVGIGLILNRMEARGQSAQNALYAAQKAVESDLKTLALARFPKDPAKSEDGAVKDKAQKELMESAANLEKVSALRFDVDAEIKEGVKKLNQVLKDYEGTRAAFEARLTLADLYFDHGQVEKSLSHYEAAASKAPTALDRVLALKALGATHESLKKYPEAVVAYEKAVGSGDGFLKPQLLLSIGRTYELSGDPAKAKLKYDEILSQFPNTEASQAAEQAKARL